MTHKERETRRTEMKAYKAEGHTMQEVADRFGVTKGYAQSVCKGIAPQKQPVEAKRNQYTNGKFDRETNAIRWINERASGFEYAGNFTGVDGFADIRCKECGTVYRKSFVAIRHGKVRCSECARREREKLNSQKEKLKEAEQKSKEREKQYKRIKNKAYQVQIVQCECCGGLFIPKRKGTKYCSDICMKRVNNAIRKDRRIRKIKAVVIDNNITIERLYERDNGICAICGQVCDWEDYAVRKDGTFIAFDNYPSIDHIRPISKGGLHAWDNIQLACRACNTKKGAHLTSPYAV